VRDLLVAYLQERQTALDSLTSLAATLGGLFWKDLERHHPGIDSLRLPAEVAAAWKQRSVRGSLPPAATLLSGRLFPRGAAEPHVTPGQPSASLASAAYFAARGWRNRRARRPC